MTHLHLIWAFVALSLLDMLTTLRGLALGGAEANPILAFLIRTLKGPWVVVGVKLLAVALTLAFSDYLSYSALVVMNSIMVAVVLSNILWIRKTQK